MNTQKVSKRARTLKLRAPKHAKGDANRYCGPSAISILTGMTSGEAARLIRAVGGRDAIKGASHYEVTQALTRCGVAFKVVSRGGVSLAAWLKSTSGQRAGRFFLVSAGHHYQVVSGTRYACGRIGDVVSVRDKRVKRRSKVRMVWELTAPRGLVVPKVAVKPKAAADPEASARAKARRIARLIGAEIECERGSTPVVWPPEWLDEGGIPDPYEGDHYGDGSWRGALEMVEAYAKLQPMAVAA